MKNIGKKIEDLRKQKNLTQDNLLPERQSLISQLEKGQIKNPNEKTLTDIAYNMDITFQELIDGTDWDRNIVKDKKSEYVMSIFDPIVKVESGNIDIKMRTYPRYNSSGDENRYCPNTGSTLILECQKCGRSIENPSHKYCMGCGEAFYELKWEKFDLKFGATTDLKINRSEQSEIKKLKDNLDWNSLNHAINNPDVFDLDEPIKILTDIIFGEKIDYLPIFEKYKHLKLKDKYKNPTNLIWLSELQKGKDSQIEEISSFYIQEEIRERVFDGILSELKRWEIDIHLKKQDRKVEKDENK